MKWWRDAIDRESVLLGAAAMAIIALVAVFYAYVAFGEQHRRIAISMAAVGGTVAVVLLFADRLVPRLSRALEGSDPAAAIGISVGVTPFLIGLLSDRAQAWAAGFGLGFLVIVAIAMALGMLAIVVEPRAVDDGLNERDVAHLQRTQRRLRHSSVRIRRR
jgi:MFS family permease